MAKGPGGDQRHAKDCKCGKCPKIGRPRKRPTDTDLAGRVLAKAKAEEKWLELLGSENEHIVLRTLAYLTDRHEGKPTQPIDLSARRERIRDLISRLAGGARS